MKFKTFALILALFGFSASLFAESVTYSFSSFGGGLPSSAKKASFSAGADTPTTQRIIVDEDDEDDDNNYYDYSDEPTVKKGKNTALIVTYVVLGVVTVAGIGLGAYYFSSSSGKCCESATEGMIEGLAEGCGEECGEACGEACAESSSEACSESIAASCESGPSSLFANGLSLIPIYVP